MGIVRTALERASRNVVLRKHLPAECGSVPLLVSPDANLSFWKPGLQSDLFHFAQEFVNPGDVVWDVGANVGLFSVAAAQKATTTGKVFAIEADTWLVGLLRRSAAMQPSTSAQILVIPIAASEELGIASFNIAKRGRASNYLQGTEGSTQTGGVRQQVLVPRMKLDWILDQGFPAPAVLKIDVEGAELDVLRGAVRILSEFRPVILCEVRARRRQETTELFAIHRYQLYDWATREKVEIATYNTLAIPQA